MARIYLVRHGEPASGWGERDPDPGLSPLGLAQASHAAGVLRARGVSTAITSPLKRCVETAAAFEMETGIAAVRSDAVREIPTPADVADRRAWLAAVMAGKWPDHPGLEPFRGGVIAQLLALGEDTAVFSHYVAINAAVAAATDRDAVTVCKPAHASITVLTNDRGRLLLVEPGAETPAVDAL
jgi:broad specificity phosphatase PhoE